MTSPFKTFPEETSSSNKPLAIDPQEQPVYIISDLIAATSPAIKLAEEIYKQSGVKKTPVYYYEEPTGNVTIKHSNNMNEIIPVEKLTLAQHVSLLADGVSQGPETKIIIGYSTGGQLAAALASELSKRGMNVSLYIIDEPSFAVTANFANAEQYSQSFNQELVKAAKYAAQEAGLKTPSAIPAPDECQATISRVELFTHELVKQAQAAVAALASEIAKQSTNNAIKLSANVFEEKKVAKKAYEKFIRNVKTFNRNVVNLIHRGNETHPERKLPEAHVLFTDETAKKYGASSSDGYTGGWLQYFEKVESIDPEHMLKGASHMSLLSAENVKLVATLIIRDLQLGIKPSDVMQQQFATIFLNASKAGVSPAEVQKRMNVQFFNFFRPSTHEKDDLPEGMHISPTITPASSPSDSTYDEASFRF